MDMASTRERSWSNDEKNTLLAEIIKSHSPHPSVLLNVIRNLGMNQPPWEDMLLPYGRSVNECQRQFGELLRQSSQQAVPALYTTQTIGPSTQVKRTIPEGPQYSGGREIRPKPTPTPSYGQPSASEGPSKRKRGRPTNASLAAKKAEEDTRVIQPGPMTPTQLATPLAQISPADLIPGPHSARPEDRPLPSNVPGRMHIGSILTTTPDAQGKTSSHSSSSSGKRRRIRLMKADEESAGQPLSLSQDPPRMFITTSREEGSIPRPPYMYNPGDPGTPSRSSPRATQPPPTSQPTMSQQPPTSRP